MPANLFCFKEALDARLNGEIALEECLRHVVAHYKGMIPTVDTADKGPWIPEGFECEVRDLVLDKNYQPLTDDNTATIYSIFSNGFQGDVHAVRNLLGSSKIGPEYYLRPLMRISVETGDSQLLRLCFETGFSPTDLDSSSLLYWRVRNNPTTAWLDVLFEFDFLQWRTDPQKLNQYQTWNYVLRMGPDCARWWIERGGRKPTCRGLFSAPQKQPWPGAATFRVLLDQFGIDWFRDSGTLQLAVRNHDMETVKMLLEAGADINEEVNDWNTDIRERRAAPLPALKEAIYAKSETTIRYLVENGARLSPRYVADPYNNMPEEFKPFRDLVVELGAVRK